MSNVHELNIAIELWGAGFCTLGIASILILLRADRTFRGLLIAIFASELVMIVGDAVAGIFRGQAGSLAWTMTHIGNFSTFLGGFAAIVCVTWYVCARIADAGGPVLRRWSIGVGSVAIVMAVLTLAGVFYTIDDVNVYHRTDWFWLSQAFTLAVNLVNAGVLVRWREKLSGAAFAVLMLLVLSPAASSAVIAFVYGLNLNVMAAVFSTVIVYLEIQAHSSRMLQQRTEELAAARVEASQSRIAVMVSQIQPHFIFNTLDTIYGLVDEDAELAKHAIASFSRYLRANLDSLNRAAPVLIEKELELVRTYLDLERMSDEGRLEYRIDVEATGFSVPALSVQTLVENAVKHGTSKKLEGGTVIVRTYEQDDDYLVKVVDDGVGFDFSDAAADDGVGITNTRERLAALCEGALEIESAPGAGATVVMRVPKHDRSK